MERMVYLCFGVILFWFCYLFVIGVFFVVIRCYNMDRVYKVYLNMGLGDNLVVVDYDLIFDVVVSYVLLYSRDM